MSSYVVSIIRTLVPSLWGAAIAWLLARIPALEPARDDLVGLGLVLVAVCIAGYYALVRKLEPHLPDWLRTVLIGAAVAPAVYANDPADVVAVEVAKPADADGVVSETIDTSGDSGGTVVPTRKPYWDPV